MNVRRYALRLLLRAEEDGSFVNLLLPPRDADGGEEAARDRALLCALLYGCVERRLTLDYAIATLTKRSADSLSPHTRNLLRLGLYQLYFMEKIPAFAAVSESVSLAGNRGEASLVNACLRAAAKGSPPLPPREKNPARYLSVAYSFPLPTVKLFLSLYGEEETEALLRAFNAPPSLTLRVNTLKITRDAYLSLLGENGIEALPTAYSPFGVRLRESIDPTLLPLYREGGFFVQDEASQVEALALDVRNGDTVLDACACPGGKTFSAAIESGDCGHVVASDISASKLPLIESGAARLSLSSVTSRVHDARVADDALRGQCDRVICDVPCSGLGVLAKKPDLRYLSLDRFDTLIPIQREILRASAEAVKRGGVLVYSTCTLNPDENTGVVSEFLAEREDFTPVDFTAGTLSSQNGMLTLLPHREGTDGFFIAKLQRK